MVGALVNMRSGGEYWGLKIFLFFLAICVDTEGTVVV